jgi:plastocyanin
MRVSAKLVVIGVAAVASMGCSNPTYGGNSGGRTTSISVGATGNSFVPQFDTVASGAIVTWTWSGGPHTVTFETLADSSAQKSAGTFSVRFGIPGTYRYRCVIHSTTFTNGMSGSVAVE